MNSQPEPQHGLSVRLDKWLWAVRLFKTRALAASACRLGQVTIDAKPAKAAAEVRIGQTIQAQVGEIMRITRTFRVVALLERRVGAAVVKDFAEDLTPASEYEKLKKPSIPPLFVRPKGAGRPTKKERRALDFFADPERDPL